ncbi:ATP-binding response regulator [Pseudogracilibacillus sp. ICA-222130]|uniref:ATP-binding response regulator n=1 Tax=Pseudogracilibacillus sp. ICA-222130 TaxID=3134655 RepID=UPI0030BCB345
MTKKKITIKHVFIMILFAMVLFSFRYIWLQYFSNSETVEVENGEVFITEKPKLEDKVQLIGKWAFYPNELLEEVPIEEENRVFLQVPGGWSNGFEEESTYGYGTYHLRIHVDPEVEQSYSLRMFSVRSASKVIANGYEVGSSGTVSDTEETYEAFNVPYNTYSIRPDENGIIDVLVQVSNFTDPRSSGIVRSVYFGNESSIESTTYISSVLQVFTGTIFILLTFFAIIIYFVGIRKKEILYCSLGLFMLAILSLNSGDEKIIMQLIKIDYVLSYKFTMVILFILSLAIIQVLKRNIQQIHPKIVPIYSIILIILTILSIFVPMEYLESAVMVTMGAAFVSMIIVIISLIRSKLSFSNHFGLILASIAMINHFAWFSYIMKSGIKVMYYPFDLIIAIICLAVVWFKHYYDMNVKFQIQAKKLAKADKEKDLFLANTAHEIKNPLHSILNMSSAVLEREYQHLEEESKKDLETVLAVSRRMSILVNDLLELSLLNDRKPTLYIRKTSLQGVVEGVIHMTSYFLVKKDVEIVNRISIDFPYVLADENRLTQIMYNLVHNAVKFTEQGTITIDADVEDGTAYISITDTGIGIDEAILSDLFLPYRQGNIPYRANEAGGLGLGLYITKQLVEHMSGEIDVQSTIGEGTTFTFTLPIGDETGTYEHKSFMENNGAHVHNGEVFADQGIFLETHDVKKIAHTVIRKEQPKVIVVDDDPINLRVMEVVLHNEQYDVTTALSGVEVMQLLEQSEYDLVISDVMMPHMSGFELTKNIRKRFTMSELPIILLTSRDRIRDVKYGFDVGANDYITKPIDAIELKARVQALTDVRSAARESLYLEAAFLQAQIQPHFIFNTINSIFALSEIDIKRMQKLLEAFSDVLRSKFQFKNMKEFVDLKQELQLIEAYLYIEQVRFGDRVKVVWEIDDCKNVQIPAITIQPLVENAILHGITTRSSGGTITIKVINREKEVEIVVEDDGVGIPKDTLDRIHNQERVGKSGVGIYNTNLRLLRTYGKGLHIESEKGKGTKISFKIPKEKPNQQ